jgi:predicted dehydrogenase
MMPNQSFNRRSFLKTLGAAALGAPFITRGLMAQSPNGMVRHASFGAAGMAWSDVSEFSKFPQFKLVAVAEVDLNRTAELKKKFPDVTVYQDWRKLLDKEAKNIDSVNVSTPDHMHASIDMSALQLGKHVYGQKPLAHDLYEVRKLTEFVNRGNLVTQMGIQIQSVNHYRLAVRLVQDGVIGKIKETHSWCPKSWGDPAPLPANSDPVPAGFDWDLWQGVCSSRPYIGNGYFHPATWRKRLDFGTGTFGDMGCHILDPVFKALGLHAPISVRSEGPAPNQWNWAMDSRIHYIFPGNERTAEKTLPVTWYDGTSKPPAEVLNLLEGDARPDSGSIFIGTEGVLVLPHWSRPLLYPDAKFKDFKFPEVRGADHWEQFLQACLGNGKTTANFGYAGPLTETVLLGGVASRFPQTTLKWDAAELKFEEKEANHFIRRKYRDGWGLRGLS